MKLALNMEPVTTANASELEFATDADGHCAPLATHLWRREGKVVGACGVFAPLATFWAHTQLSPRESIALVEEFKALADGRGVTYLTACSPESPFQLLMPRFGFRRLGSLDFYDAPR